ncbi:hypothetical protein GIB67_006334 [Kingdonia uniflora]|uniref:Uncharacterized protein n=1 Tax=Kingdonia uniflora TaxID=39325 RepID=A0A7J7P1A7_9MAGN|nr:hypothetical protein GIB67_006334 [Kingdonia uniflora]
MFLCSNGESSNNFSRDSLDDFLRDSAFDTLVHPRTGVLYKANLPASISGMEVSIVRIRSGSFYARGANFSGFNIPSRIIPVPYVKRIAIIYQNLGNWSSLYYDVPGYSMVTPVVGFFAYDAPNTSVDGTPKINLSAIDTPISITFPQLALPQGSNSSVLRCVRLGVNRSIDFSDMVTPSVCNTHVEGHFTVVIPALQPKKTEKKNDKIWKLAAIGFVSGFVALVLIGLFGITVFKFVKLRKIGKMEKRADEGEAFDTVWIGSSKMPSATFSRTQPVLEHRETP